MKSITTYVTIVFCLVLISSCGSGKFGDVGKPKEARSAERYGLDDSLADVLRRHGGVQVSGSGYDASVTIRGNSNSIKGEVRPLFVLNGVILGHGVQKANSLVVPTEIHSIKIKRSLSETAIYGEDGRNGVIEIRTKTNKDNKEEPKQKLTID